jgi:hypothetical protein
MHFIKPTLVLQRDGQYGMPAVETAECNVVAMGIGVDLVAIVIHYQKVRDFHGRSPE